MNCRLVLSFLSQFFHSRRFFSSHAKLRSTTPSALESPQKCVTHCAWRFAQSHHHPGFPAPRAQRPGEAAGAGAGLAQSRGAQALDAPRWQWVGGKKVEVEQETPNYIIRQLQRMGHQIVVQPDPYHMGRGQVILRDENGVLYGATEKRTDGQIMSY